MLGCNPKQMRILGIETSCDETAIAILDAEGDIQDHRFSILADTLLSQAKLHAEYGGVFPALAKREHAKNLVPLLELALNQAKMNKEISKPDLNINDKTNLEKLLEREPGLCEQLVTFLENHQKPDIDVIAVTHGPGLEPALWVGINFAKALSLAWNVPVIPINHMEGHIVGSLLSEEIRLGTVHFPALALLISGGHTELVLIKDWMDYQLLGSTRDDAVGEAFDKVARTLGLTYPGGPEIARLAAKARMKNSKSSYTLPRPMINTDDCDFSFSGLKTAVLYQVQEIKNLTERDKQEFAQEFEDAVVEILLKKTIRAIEENNIETLILGGGVSANTEIRSAFKNLFANEYPQKLLYIPETKLSTDNAVMIAIAGFLRAQNPPLGGRTPKFLDFRAEGNLKL